MPQQTFRLAVLVETLADDICLAEALLFPGISCLAHRPEQVRKRLAKLVGDQLRRLPPGDLHRRRLAETPRVESVEVEVPPIRGDVRRKNAVTLQFHYLAWQHGDEAAIAYLPSLGIEVLAENEERLAELLVPQIRAALGRRRSAESLRDLVLLARPQRLDVRRLPLNMKLPSLKERAVREERAEERKKSLLKTIAVDLTKPPHARFYERAAELARVAELLTATTARSVLLVGRSGVGKSALVGELARRRAEWGLGDAPFWSTSGSRIVAGMTGFGMWQKRVQELVREASKSDCVLHLGNLIELLEVGKGGGSTQGVASLLRPEIQRGAFRAIVECTAEQLAIAERDEPQLLEAFEQVEIGEPDQATLRAILGRAAEEYRTDSFPPAALATLERLHRRYATYSAAPGRPLRFLRNFLEDRTPGEPLGPSEVTAAFSRETGLPAFMLDERLPLDLTATRAWFSERVRGQAEAVENVVGLLAAIKAGLARGGKPLASLLFIGPTGVGKTETAKALAEFLYQDPARMIRFDMSEYAHPAAVERLIGGAYESQGLLTQKVRDQPFMVVLLDEFEKAHPRLFDVLLQVLGEGRLTDAAGRTADFTNSVVIMTSNLGVETFRSAGLGFGGEAAAAAGAGRHFERELAGFLRPEMFNRIDRIVPFAPLDRDTVAGIARRELDRVLLREGIRLKGVELAIDDSVVTHLAAAGYDPRYGARPLKRAIERELVAPAAERLTSYGGDVALTCRATVVEGKLVVAADARPQHGLADFAGRPASAAALTAVDLRRKVQRLEASGFVLRLRNEIERLKQLERKRQKQAAKRPERRQPFFTPEQAKTLSQQELLDRVDDLGRRVRIAETRVLEALYTGAEHAAFEEFALLKQTFDHLLFDLYLAPRRKAGQLTLILLGGDFERVSDLAQAYLEIGAQHEAQQAAYWLALYEPAWDKAAPAATRRKPMAKGQPAPTLRLTRQLPKPPASDDESAARKGAKQGPELVKVLDAYAAKAEQLREPPLKCLGIAVQLLGNRAAMLLESEAGRHEFALAQGQKSGCRVDTVAGMLINYEPPEEIVRLRDDDTAPLRRAYNFEHEMCHDTALSMPLPLRRGGLAATIANAAEQALLKRVEGILE